MKRFFAIFLSLLLIGMVTSWVIRLLFPSDREAILRLIEKGREAIEEEDMKTLSEILSLDYLDAWGHNYHRLLSLFRRNFQVYDDIRVFLPFRKVAIEKPFAKCSLYVRISGKERSYGEELIYASPLVIYLIKENSRWYVISASE